MKMKNKGFSQSSKIDAIVHVPREKKMNKERILGTHRVNKCKSIEDKLGSGEATLTSK